MQIHFLRHATFILKLKNIQLLVDPMLSPAESMDPIGGAASNKRIPMVGLPLSAEELTDVLSQITAVLVSHRHHDHWDAHAKALLRKDIQIFCQPEDEARIKADGFKNVTSIQSEHVWEGITLRRTGGRHGSGETGKRMGTVSGFVITAEGEPTLYIAGDTILCPEVTDALQKHKPDVVVVNAGGTRFLTGWPITMTSEDVAAVCRPISSARIVAVHMEVVNHCVETREDLRKFLEKENLLKQVLIPADGDVLTF
jgi:L-ascorbate metabolism protein UlaG (beta-lactamase superfamily)